MPDDTPKQKYYGSNWNELDAAIRTLAREIEYLRGSGAEFPNPPPPFFLNYPTDTVDPLFGWFWYEDQSDESHPLEVGKDNGRTTSESGHLPETFAVVALPVALPMLVQPDPLHVPPRKDYWTGGIDGSRPFPTDEIQGTILFSVVAAAISYAADVTAYVAEVQAIIASQPDNSEVKAAFAEVQAQWSEARKWRYSAGRKQ